MQLHTTLDQFRAAALVSLAVFVASAGLSLAQDAAVAPPPTGADPEGVETLTRGPVHEAFASPTANDPKPNAVVPKKPPADIDEVQPDYRPEGAIWVNGYWEWDEETKDFIWISGLWRVPPPEMRWVPPYWTEVDGGWQRVSGFWISTSTGELEYRVPPPNSLEVGPSSPAPADNYFYIPGTWTYYDTGYRWRSGYWSPYREDWVWCPARWIWTPAGCLYQSGYWDYRPLVRAQCYAPVRFTSAVYLTPGYVYRPWCVVDSSRFFVHLWIGPRANCYYFGNYYGSYATTFGFTPWCSWSYHSRSCYDPLWSWCNTHYRRQGIDYIGRCKGWHDHFDHHEHERPARTWNDQVRMVADAKLDPRKSQNVLTADLADVVKRDDLPIKLTKLDDRQRASIVKVSDDMRKLNVERLKTEREARLARTGDGDDQAKLNNKAGDTTTADVKPDDNKVADNKPTDNKVADIKTSGKPGDDKPGDSKPADSKPEGNKSIIGRSGRLPRIDSARSAGDDKAVAAAKSGEAPTGDVKSADIKPGDAKPGGDRPADGKTEVSKTARLDALSNSLSSKGGEGKRTARLKLPEQTEAIREVTRNTRVTARGRDSTPSTGLKETTIELPNQGVNRTGSSDLDRGNKPPKTGSSAGSVDLGTSTIRNRGNSRAGTPSTGITGSSIPGNSVPGNSGTGKSASGNSVGGTIGPDIKPPKIDRSGDTTAGSSGPNTNQGGNNSRSRRSSDGPTIELPKISSPGGDAPKIEWPKNQSQSNRSVETESRGSSRGSQPRIETPKFDAPKIDAPKNDGPKFDTPKVESRGNRASDNSIRSGQSRIALPTSSGSSGPKIELGSSRSGGGQPRMETSKFSAPKIDVPRASPRIEMPRSSPSNNFQSRSMSRSEGPRSSSGNSGSGNSRSRGRDRD